MSKEGDLSVAAFNIRVMLDALMNEELARSTPCDPLTFYVRFGQLVSDLVLGEINKRKASGSLGAAELHAHTLAQLVRMQAELFEKGPHAPGGPHDDG